MYIDSSVCLLAQCYNIFNGSLTIVSNVKFEQSLFKERGLCNISVVTLILQTLIVSGGVSIFDDLFALHFRSRKFV